MRAPNQTPSQTHPQVPPDPPQIPAAVLQERMALEVDPGIPLIGVIGRFVAQKGLDLLAASIERILKTMRVQFAILGTGDKGLEWYFGPIPGRYPGRVGRNGGGFIAPSRRA